jgi:hypothetical protein
METSTDWLLQGAPWVEYRARLDLLAQAENDPRVSTARQRMIAHPLVQGLLAELADWPGPVLTSHKSAGHPIHKLTFLAALGLKAEDPAVAPILERVMAHAADSGPFQVRMNIPAHFGGSGEDDWAWALCDAPLLLSALTAFGLVGDPRVQRAVEYLTGLVRENGWPCAVSPELGKFRGPGRKDDPCPYANLVMLKTLAQVPAWRDSRAARLGAEALLLAWEEREAQHAYMFFMGTDFCKLKAPLVWYDILHVLDVLVQFPWLRADPRLCSMLQIVEAKGDEQGRFTPESIWTAWKDWDFGQKRAPSPWMTFLALRILKRSSA